MNLRRSFPALIALGCTLSSLTVARSDDPPPPPAVPALTEAPITVWGRAVDTEGKPVAGATIRLLSVNVDYHVLGTTTTDAGGNYLFTEAKLPVRRGSMTRSHLGAFLVYGTAPGRGFAWHGMRFYRNVPRPANFPFPIGGNHFFEGEPMTMPLTFGPAASLGGQVVDEAGQPITGARVKIIGCDHIEIAGKPDDTNFTYFNGMQSMPDEITTATTDASGRFRLDGLPQDAWFNLRLEHPDYALKGLFAATTTRDTPAFPHPQYPPIPGKPPTMVATGDQRVTLRKTRPVRLHIVAADTGQPVPGTWVHVNRAFDHVPVVRGSMDASGHIPLTLPSGVYPMTIYPPNDGVPTPGGKPYVRGEVEATVTPGTDEQTVELRMELGCFLTLEAVDAETGQGVPNIPFFTEDDANPGVPIPVQTSTNSTSVRPPKTNLAGRVRAVVFAGERHYSLGPIPQSSGYEAVAAEKRASLPVGGDVTVRFELRKAK